MPLVFPVGSLAAPFCGLWFLELAYGPGVDFTNVSNGHGSTIRTAILKVCARPSAGSVLDKGRVAETQ